MSARRTARLRGGAELCMDDLLIASAKPIIYVWPRKHEFISRADKGNVYVLLAVAMQLKYG